MQQDLLAATLFWCALFALVIVVVLLVRQSQISNRLRARIATVESELTMRDQEVEHLVTARLPAVTESTSHMVEVPGPLHPGLANSAFGHALDVVISRFTESAEKAMARADQSAKSTLKAMMRTVQSLANEQQLAISTMQDRHDDPNVLEDLLKIDHMNSQLGRRAQAAAVLCGSWPGQQRTASPLTDVVRGATSRIRDYLRVQINDQVDTAVVSRAVEPVVLVVAEMLDNAARYSQPNTSVEVNFRPAHNGMAIVVDDAGVGMNNEELSRAEIFLGGRETVDINHLGDPPQVGFPVIGVLAARYGFKVSVDTGSPYGGVRAVVFLPTGLLTRVSAQHDAPAQPAPASAPAAPPPSAPPRADFPEEPRESTSSGLPKRRRRQPLADSSPTTEVPVEPAQPQPHRSAGIAANMGAWQRGTLSGRGNTASDREGNTQE